MPARGGTRPTLWLCALVAVAICAGTPTLWALGVLDDVEWDGDFITGVVVAGIGLAHIAVGYAFPRWRTLLVVMVLWSIPTVGHELVLAAGWNPFDIPRTDADGCDPCPGPMWGFLGVVFAIPLTVLGLVLRRLDEWFMGRRFNRAVPTS